jgi:ribosome-binding factor A
MSKFSDFFRLATDEERAIVYARVMKRVAEQQQELLDAAERHREMISVRQGSEVPPPTTQRIE